MEIVDWLGPVGAWVVSFVLLGYPISWVMFYWCSPNPYKKLLFDYIESLNDILRMVMTGKFVDDVFLTLSSTG